MQKKYTDTIKTSVLLLVVISAVRSIELFPWWSFILPVLALGLLVGARKWHVSGFATGFCVGFLLWFGLNWYLDVTQNGIVLGKVGQLLSVPKVVILLIAGSIGGLLTGLALFTGKSMSAFGLSGFKNLED